MQFHMIWEHPLDTIYLDLYKHEQLLSNTVHYSMEWFHNQCNMSLLDWYMVMQVAVEVKVEVKVEGKEVEKEEGKVVERDSLHLVVVHHWNSGIW